MAVLIASFSSEWTASATPMAVGQPYGGRPIVVPFPKCAVHTRACPTPYRVKSIPGFGRTHRVHVTYWNEGPAIPHLIVRFDSFGALTLTGIWVRLTIDDLRSR